MREFKKCDTEIERIEKIRKYNSSLREFFDSFKTGDIILFQRKATSFGTLIRISKNKKWSQGQIIFRNKNYLQLDCSGENISIRFDEIVSQEIQIQKKDL